MSETTDPHQAQGAPNNHSELPDYSDESRSPAHPSITGITHPQTRRRLLIGGGVILLLILLPPLYRGAKEWRSGILVGNAELSFSTGDPTKALSLLKQALALSPGSPRVQHAVELYNARSGDQPSIKKLLERMRSGSSSPDELLGIAELEIAAAHPDIVREAIKALPAKLSEQQLLLRTLAVASLLAQHGDFPKAAETCLSDEVSFSQDNTSRLRIQAAVYLLASKNADASKNAVSLLQQVLKKHGKISLAAWRLLARIVLSPPQGSTGLLSPEEITALIKSLETLPGHTAMDSLTAADMEILQNPSGKGEIVKRLKSKYRLASRIEALEFARWLNARGFHEEVLEVAGPERPLKDTDWLLITLDAETALGNWKEVSKTLDSPAGAGIPDAVRHLFLARVALMSGDQNRAEDEWRNVGGALHLEKPETLAYVAGYEEQIGASDRAARAYREMADREGATKIPGLIGLIRCQPRNAPAVELIPMYVELVTAAPSMADAKGDLAYLRLLANDDVSEASAMAAILLEDQPDNLSRISVAALAKLRGGDSKAALALYEGKMIDWTVAPDQWRVIRGAVLRANGEGESSEAQLSSLNMANLRPEERKLLESTIPPPSPQFSPDKKQKSKAL
jgi:hypothetical protein